MRPARTSPAGFVGTGSRPAVRPDGYLPSGQRLRAQDELLCYLLLAGLLLTYGEIGRGLLFNPLRAGGAEEPYAFLANYARYLQIIGTIAVAALGGAASIGRPLRLMTPLLPFAIVSALTLIWSVDREFTARYSILLFGLLVISAFLVDRLGPVRVVKGVLHFLAFLMIVSLIVALLWPVVGRHDPSDLAELGHVGRWRGIFAHKNALGAYAAFAAVLLFTHSHLIKGGFVYLWIARICALVCLAMSGSSTAVFGVVVLLLTYVMFIRRQLAHPIVLMFVFVFAVLAFQFLSSEMVAEWLGRDATFSGRTEIWRAAIGIWSEQPLGGYGYSAATAWVLAPTLTEALFTSAIDAHNAYIDVLLDCGLLGLGALLFGILVGLWRGYVGALTLEGPQRSATIALLMLVLGNCAMAMGEVSPFRIVGNGGYLLFLASVALCYSYRRMPRH
ncbi:MAG TPA: O-antigen ligase family protein [Microvirga sp.]|jgi:O-antigen ligase